MNPHTTLRTALFACLPALLSAQISFTANDTVPPFKGHFRPGANMGMYYGWTDEQIADIAAGNPALGIEGAGVKAFRPFLFEHFLEAWGYDIRLNAFQHYDSLGIRDNTVCIGYPSPQHRDPNWHCSHEQSQLFANMYLPIWDGGANGTPVNEQNYYAYYLWRMVNVYKDQVRFWEIWNEPDADYSGNAWKPEGWGGNWWENTPQPCDYVLRAPIYHYIRMLRISYEVIKTIDPEAYVAVGGLGYPAFLDALLRHTDNPNGGTVTWEYPHLGGAWFDVMAFHSYPHLDGSMRYWDNNIMGFAYTRHSDAAVEGTLRLKKDFEKVLGHRGYDGAPYPKKEFIITEGNLPRISIGEYIGNAETQRNYLLKMLAECQRHRIRQYDAFIIADLAPEWPTPDAFQSMGLYKWLTNYSLYNVPKNEAGVAYKTYTDLLFGKQYDATQTALLNMPYGSKGLAFLDTATNEYTYMLWAKTTQDQSEAGNVICWLPAALGLTQLNIFKWDYSLTHDSLLLPADYLKLNTSPIFVRDALATGERSAGRPSRTPATDKPLLRCHPNPFTTSTNVVFHLPQAGEASMEIFDVQGRLMQRLLDRVSLDAGGHELEFSSPQAGLYWVRCSLNGQVATERVLCR